MSRERRKVWVRASSWGDDDDLTTAYYPHVEYGSRLSLHHPWAVGSPGIQRLTPSP